MIKVVPDMELFQIIKKFIRKSLLNSQKYYYRYHNMRDGVVSCIMLRAFLKIVISAN